ncbi:hypothetical protein [Georgenia thermotolerans]|uniref:Sulfate permease n=1 Tax=Georgenia thermotolerans TaxID=527326 RepID=A0A7J5USH6_9MICO|nr:hypothetical protein [Georgenia thermotolerans]KAE8765356.1 hypothetical protein GB883_04125 [Georgenia thermotolerans]
MVFRLSFALTRMVIAAFQLWMPTNQLVRWIYTDRGLKWGAPIAVVLAPAYFQLGHLFQERIETGGSGWWWLALAWAVINCLKFVSVAVRAPLMWAYRAARRAIRRGAAGPTRAAV